jgi:hypothetical protein
VYRRDSQVLAFRVVTELKAVIGQYSTVWAGQEINRTFLLAISGALRIELLALHPDATAKMHDLFLDRPYAQILVVILSMNWHNVGLRKGLF